jgi:hypothetical protein
MVTSPQPLEIQIWPIDRLVLYARSPRKNDAAVDRMRSSIREFGFKIPVVVMAPFSRSSTVVPTGPSQEHWGHHSDAAEDHDLHH